MENLCNGIVFDENPQDLYNKFESITLTAMENNLKRKTAKPTRNFVVHKKFNHLAKEITKFAAKGKVQRKVARKYREKLLLMNTDEVASKNAANLVTAVQQLSENDQFSAQKFWRMKKRMQKSPKSVSSVYRKDGEEVFNDKDIVKQYKEEFEDRLSSVQISPCLAEYNALTDMTV